MTPLVSIGIPTYNGAQFLRECLDSILGQTFEGFEVNLVDDCSSDETVAIAEMYAKQNPRIAVHLNPTRLGLVGNFNRCVALARGKYVCIFGQDDVMMPENLARKVEILEANPHVGFVHSNIYQLNDEGAVIKEHWTSDSTADYIRNGNEVFFLLLFGKNHICCPSVLARKSCYDRFGGFGRNLFYTCDWEMWMRLSLHFDVACIGTPLIKFRRHRGSESSRLQYTVTGMVQEFLAKSYVLSRERLHIPNAGPLWRSVKLSLAEEGLASAVKKYYEGDLRTSFEFCRVALKANPSLIKKSRCWKLILKLLLVDPLLKVLGSIKSIR